MRGILGLRVGGEMAPSMLLWMTWRRAVSRDFEVSGERTVVEDSVNFITLLAVFESKYRVRSVNLRVSSEDDEDVEVSDNNDKDCSRDLSTVCFCY